MKLLQPFPNHECSIAVPPGRRVKPSKQINFLRYRYPHHARASGYDRLCDYVVGHTIYPSKGLYLAGETVLRPIGLGYSRIGRHFEYSRYDYVMELALRRRFEEVSGEVFHFVYAEKSYRLSRKLAGKRDNRLVATVHHQKEHHAWLFPNVEHFKAVDAIITLTQGLAKVWSEKIGSGAKVHYIPYGIDTEYFRPGPRVNGRKRCVFSGFHGRDFDVLEKVIRVLVERYKDLEFFVLTTNPRGEDIARISERVRYSRWIDDAGYLELLQTSDLMILPVKEDTANTAMLEALACGLPVVSNDGSPADYVTESCGAILAVGDHDGVIDASIELLNDESVRAIKSEAARVRAQEFSWERVARKTADLYESLY